MDDKERELSVFIDESGTTDINPELYICAAIMIPTTDVEKAFAHIQNTASHFGYKIIKSNWIRNATTRTQMLKELCSLEFSYLALIVNKGALDQYPGLQFSGSFYKYLHRKFASYLESTAQYSKLHFYIDSFGSKAFEDEFDKYFSDRISSLLPTVTWEIVQDESNFGVQAADLIAGTLGKCYFYNRDSENADTWVKILDPKCAGHKIFPPQSENEKEIVLGETIEDQDIADCLLKNAKDFLAKNMNSDDDFVQRQCETLQLLLVRREYSGDNFIFSGEIMGFLEAQGFSRISKQLFTSRVIGKLRDSQIIITGNPHGYRLALSKEDIKNYLRHNDAIISPMVHRLELATELLKGAFRTNILQDFNNLQEFVRVYRHNETMVGTEIDEQVVDATDLTDRQKNESVKEGQNG